ncbi:hypothetical protein Tco_1376256 [Tanacetum coccineum]
MVTSHSVQSTQELKVVNNTKVIAPGMFRINPTMNSRVDNFMPNKHVKASVRTKPITVSQPHVITKKYFNSNTNGLPSIGVESTSKTKRPQPMSNPKNDMIPSVSKSSCLLNNIEKVEVNHRNLLFSKTPNHRSSADRREDIRKLGAKGDIGFFIGYSTTSCAYRQCMMITFGQPSTAPRTAPAAPVPQVLHTQKASTTTAEHATDINKIHPPQACMTRSSTKELLSPFENPKQKFHSKRRLFDTPSLVEFNLPEFNHNFDIQEQSEEGGQFLKELHDNTSGGSEHEDANEHIEKVLEIVDLFHIPKPSGSITTWEVLKTKFLNKYCPPARTAKKIEEINNFQQEPDESLFHAWERFKELLMKCPQHYLTDMQEVILFYNGLDVPTRQILDSKGAIPSKTIANAKIAIQEMAEYSQKWRNGTSSRTSITKTSDGLATIQAKLNNLGREIKKVNEKVYAAQVGCELCKGPHYTKDCPQKEEGKTLEEAYYTYFGAPYQPGGQYRATGPGFYQRNNRNSSYPNRRPSLEESLTKFMMSKVLQERGFGSLPSSTETNPRDQVKSISTAKADFSGIRRIRCDPYAVSGTQHRSIWSETVPFPGRLLNFSCNDWREAQDVKILDAYDHTLPQKEKDPGSFTLPCFIHNICFDKALVDLGASVSVMPFSTYTNLGLGILSHTRLTIELADRTIKQPRGFTIIDDDDMTKDVVLGMRFCKKYASCQRIMKKFALGNNYERIMEEE